MIIGIQMTCDTKALTTTQPNTALASVVDKARQFAANSKAKNTIRAYQADWEHFRGWCAEYQACALPATPATVALYIADLASTAKVATITRRLAAISKAHQAAGCESPCTMKHAAVKEVLDGIKRTKTTAQTGKAALLTDSLRSLMRAIPDSLLGKRDAALLLLGFAGGFRRSELVALTIADIEHCDDGVKVTLRRSKTDQEGQGRVVGIPHGSNPQLCPVRALRHWLDAASIASGPLFRSVDRHGNVSSSALTDQMVGRVLKRYCADAGLKVAEFGAHSLRAGMATQAAINGASERSIMRQTGHKSAAMVRRYIRDSELFRDNAAGRLGL
jgi:site-specific recombinase XerD